MRASLYNAVTVEEAEALAAFMKEFQKEHQWAAEAAVTKWPSIAVVLLNVQLFVGSEFLKTPLTITDEPMFHLKKEK